MSYLCVIVVVIHFPAFPHLSAGNSVAQDHQRRQAELERQEPTHLAPVVLTQSVKYAESSEFSLATVDFRSDTDVFRQTSCKAEI